MSVVRVSLSKLRDQALNVGRPTADTSNSEPCTQLIVNIISYILSLNVNTVLSVKFTSLVTHLLQLSKPVCGPVSVCGGIEKRR